ncbi:hypothetical protein EYF80_016904 [Liparis tanakae]|uniref:Uncharacterized protein n=1 Tax=Liparis tanakae TaxID=230148 RepID=A0A4Z2I6D7_9TELE|nr:hypothetical protein EYF80_016904 [Liparis tanakae]
MAGPASGVWTVTHNQAPAVAVDTETPLDWTTYDGCDPKRATVSQILSDRCSQCKKHQWPLCRHNCCFKER